jgi:hypothetical protein
LHLLQKLFSIEVWDEVRRAMPVHSNEDSETLEEAFSNAWVDFSHFGRLGDHESFEIGFATRLLTRGTAIQVYDNQENKDMGISVHFNEIDASTGAEIETEINEKNMSIVQLQIKNAKLVAAVSPPNPRLVGRINERRPILSIVM